jgi:hypothetical protein
LEFSEKDVEGDLDVFYLGFFGVGLEGGFDLVNELEDLVFREELEVVGLWLNRYQD